MQINYFDLLLSKNKEEVAITEVSYPTFILEESTVYSYITNFQLIANKIFKRNSSWLRTKINNLCGININRANRLKGKLNIILMNQKLKLLYDTYLLCDICSKTLLKFVNDKTGQTKICLSCGAEKKI